MNILLANKFFWLNGGAERVFFQERDFLLSRGHRVVDFSMSNPGNLASPYADHFVSQREYLRAQGAGKTLRSALAFIHSPEARTKLSRLLDQTRPQLAHLHNIYHQLTPSIIPQLRRRGIGTVLTLHDFKLVCPAYLMLNQGAVCMACRGRRFHHAFTSGCQDSRLRGLLLMAEGYYHAWTRSYDAVDRFIAPSRFMAELMGQRRIPPARISLLRNGIDLAAYPPTWRDGGYALYFGRLSREKGVDILLTAHAEAGKDIPLRIAGAGPLEDELRAHYPQAQFLGHKSGAELRELVADSSFVVVPSQWYENCSMAVLEAMALGKPVLATRAGGLPEQIEDGHTGLLCEMASPGDLAEKMRALWTDPGLRAAMGRAARRKAECEYSLEAHCQGLLGIYAEVLTPS